MTDGFDHLKLSEADAAMLDRLVDVGFELDQLEYLSSEEKQRATAILEQLGYLWGSFLGYFGVLVGVLAAFVCVLAAI